MLPIAVLTGLATMLLWGVGDFLQAIVVRRLGTYKTMFLGNVIGLLPSAIILAIFWREISISTLDFTILLIGGVINVATSYYLFESIRVGEVSVVLPISGSFSIVTVILSVTMLKEALTWLEGASILLIVAGIILTSTDLRKLKHLHAAKGVREATITMVLWGVYFFLLGLVGKNVNMITLYILSGLTITFLVIIYSLLKGGMVTRQDLKKKNVLLLTAINTFIFMSAWMIYNIGIDIEKISLVTPISSLSPAVATILAIIFLKEKLVPNQRLGILIIMCGLFLISI